jgi:hypothetical protein
MRSSLCVSGDPAPGTSDVPVAQAVEAVQAAPAFAG